MPNSTSSIETFFRRLPPNTLRKGSYAWFGVVVFYTWSPLVSGILTLILLASLFLITAQNRLWETRLQQETIDRGKEAYVDRPHIPASHQIRNLALALLVSAFVGFIFADRLSLSGLQWFMIMAGFFILQLDIKLFGAPTTYIITDEGIGIRLVDTKLKLDFAEIQQARPIQITDKTPEHWTIMAPARSVRKGLLLIPRRREGFTRLIDHILIEPTDLPSFIAHLPPKLVID